MNTGPAFGTIETAANAPPERTIAVEPATLSPAAVDYVPPAERLSLWRRVWPALTLFFLSPWVAEYLLGNISVTVLGAMIVLAPLYGGGAILVREAARRAGRGWPTILLLALAYALIEEALVTQTLFNPNCYGLRLLDEAFIPALGIGGWWTLFVLAIHTVWSIAVPIALVESLIPDRARKPWLGAFGLLVTTALFALGAATSFAFTRKSQHFMAPPSQWVGASVAIVAVTAAAFLPPRSRRQTDCPAPNPWLVGAFALLVSSGFMTLRVVLHGWLIVMAYGVLFAAVTASILAWSRRQTWSPVHRFALAGGALLTYAWYGFAQHPTVGAAGKVAFIGNGVFAAMAVALLFVAARRVARAKATAA
jgi:hypothetical protein